MRVLRLTVCALLFIAPLPARAASVPPSIDRLTRSAGVVVEGRVTALRGDWNPEHTQIFTTVTLDVSQTYKGDVPTGPMQFRYLGGTVGDMALLLVDQPTFATGEHVFLFLHPDCTRVIEPVVGFNAGKFRVEVDASGAERLVGEGVSIAKADAVRSVRSVPGSRTER